MIEDPKFNDSETRDWASAEEAAASRPYSAYSEEPEALLSTSDFEFLKNLGIGA